MNKNANKGRAHVNLEKCMLKAIKFGSTEKQTTSNVNFNEMPPLDVIIACMRRIIPLMTLRMALCGKCSHSS